MLSPLTRASKLAVWGRKKQRLDRISLVHIIRVNDRLGSRDEPQNIRQRYVRSKLN